jgi:hypothetical protein
MYEIVPHNISPERPICPATNYPHIAHLQANMVEVIKLDDMVVSLIRNRILWGIVNQVADHTVTNSIDFYSWVPSLQKLRVVMNVVV